MQRLSIISFLLIATLFNLSAQSWEISEVGALPEAVTNNAVVEGFVNDVPYIFSFSGLDETKVPSGIHLKSW